MKSCAAAALAGSVALAACALAFGPQPLLRGWLAATLALAGLPLGCLLLLMVDHLIPEGWSLRLEAVLEAAALTMPLIGLALLPPLVAAAQVWPWAEPVPWRDDWPNQHWLRPGLFAIRALFYVTLWSGFAWATRTRGVARPAAAAAGLVALTLTATLAAIDWAMSLEPAFRSTIYGLMVLTAQTTGALAFAILAARPRRPGPVAAVLLSLVMLWSYVDFCQYLIVWSADLPHEVMWYLRRVGGGWTLLVWTLAVGGALVFLALLPGRVRHSSRALARIALAVLGLRLGESLWWIVPAWDAPPLPILASATASLAALGGLWGMAFLALAARRPLEARHG